MSPALVCTVVFVIILVAYIVALNRQAQAREDARNNAYYAYQEGLTRLKAQPGNADLKQQVLQLGRVYSEHTRKGRVTLFDEIALQNDLNAATAGAMQSAQPVPRTPTERLQRLTELRAQGLISEQEYTEQRRQILSEL